MARKKHLINVHTSTGTTAPTSASLYLGEIAVQHTPNDPALWIKVGTAQSSTEYEKFIGKTEITNLFQASTILGSGYTYSGLSYVNSATTIADAYSALTKELFDDELVIATALNDLNNRVDTLSGATGDNTEILECVQENEEVVAGALNNLDKRLGTVETHMTGDYIPITGYMVASGSSEEELTLNDGDTVNEALGKLQKQMLDNEEAIAAGLNDLNTRLKNVDDVIAHNTGITQLSGAVRSLSAATVNGLGELYNNVENNFYNKQAIDSFTSATSSATQSLSSATQTYAKATLTVNLNGVEQGKYAPQSGNTVIDLTAVTNGSDVLLTGYELATGTTEEELAILATDTVNEAFGKIQKQNYDNEAVIAGALNNLDERITLLEASRTEVDPVYSSSAAATITQDNIDNWNTISGGGSSDPNSITGITMNGGQVNVSNRVAKLGTVVTTQTQLSKEAATGTGNVVTDINVSNHQITLVKSYSAAPADQFVELSGATTGINITLTAHTNNGDIHVTAANKTTWNGKQDAISDLAEIRSNAASGMVAYNNVNALSAGTVSELAKKSNTGHTHTISEVSGLQTALDGKSDTDHTHSDYATTGTVNTLNNTVTAHTANTEIHVTTAQTAAWDGKQDAIADLETIRSNAEAGAAKVSNVQADWNTTATTDESYIKNKPTIPTVPTSNTAFTNDAGYITGYTETDPTVPAWAKAENKPTYTASEVGALSTGTTLDDIADGTTRKLSDYATTGTVNTLNNTVTAHTADTTIHVTSAEKSTWNGKQDVINDLETIRSNAEAGAAKVSNVQSDWNATTGLAVILNKPTIPSAPGTLTTTATTAQSTATNETLAGNISLHKVSKTGSYNDLTNKPTIPTVPAWATASTKPTYTASEVGALPTGTTLDDIVDGTTRKLSDYATATNLNNLSGGTTAHTSNSAIHIPTGGTEGQVLMIQNGVPTWVTPSTITYSSSVPTGGNDGDIWIQTS